MAVKGFEVGCLIAVKIHKISVRRAGAYYFGIIMDLILLTLFAVRVCYAMFP